MDVILQVADHFVLDNVWAKLVPMPDNVAALAGTSATHTTLDGAHKSWLISLANSLPTSLRPPPVSSVLSGNVSASSSHLFSKTTLSPLSQSAWPQDYIIRQIISVATLTILGIVLLYVLFASLSYYFIFDKRMMRHPRFLKNQIRLEILCSMWAFPWMTVLTMPWFMGEVRGYSKLYTGVEKYGWTYLILSIPL